MATAPRGRLTGSVSWDWSMIPRPGARSWRDWGLDTLIMAMSVPSALAYLHREGLQPSLGTVALLLVSTVPIVLRRIWPLAVFGWVYLATVVSLLLEPRLVPSLAVLVAMYTVAARSSRRQALAAAALLEIGAIAFAVRLQGSDWWYAAIPLTGLLAASIAFGLYSATRQDYLAELQERAIRLERERDQQGELAAAAERSRIAREVHDIVAHHLTVIVALSDGALAAGTARPERTADVLRAVSTTGRQALADTRLLLGVLRDETSDGNRQPLPDLTGLDGLIEGVRGAGLPVSFEVRGSAATISPGLQLTAYRVVQEALTNTLKHAGTGARAVVRLHHQPDQLNLEVEDDGRGSGATAPNGAGRGLAGMRERVHAVQGEFQAGPRPTGGWRVRVRLPLQAVPLPPVPLEPVGRAAVPE